jgi:phosphate starvation-inducible protein PhoH
MENYQRTLMFSDIEPRRLGQRRRLMQIAEKSIRNYFAPIGTAWTVLKSALHWIATRHQKPM